MAQQNFLFSIPLLMNFKKYKIWATLFECHVRGKSRKMWDIISKENYIPTKTENGKIIEKPISEWTNEDKIWNQLNFEAKDMLYSALNSVELERVSSCKTANEIWQSLSETHGENGQKASVGRSWSVNEKVEEICLMADVEKEVSTSCSINVDSDYNDDVIFDYDNLEQLKTSFYQMVNLVKKYSKTNDKLRKTLFSKEKEIHDLNMKISVDAEVHESMSEEIACLKTKLCEKNICNSCVILNDKIACLIDENAICAKCDILKEENVCLKAKCDLLEKDKSLANAFKTSNEKVLNMLNMSNRINCRKGLGSDTCKDKCSCVPIKKCYEPPIVQMRKPFVQKPPYVHKMNNVNYVPRKSNAFMYNDKFSRSRNKVNMHVPFYVFDEYNRKIKMVRKWIPKGMFTVDNPGGMRLWF